MSQKEEYDEYSHYAGLLVEIFKPPMSHLLDYVCALLRVNLRYNVGWDSLEESREVLQDLVQLNKLDLTDDSFPDSQKTHLRLHLLSYAHLIEMSAPYQVIVNLLRVKAGLPYSSNPFNEPVEKTLPRVKAKSYVALKGRPGTISPQQKIAEIKHLAEKAGIKELGKVFDDFFFPSLRNAIAHSNYVIHGNELHMTRNFITHETKSTHLTPVISMSRLENIMSSAYNFYTAFFTLESLARSEFSQFENQVFPYDLQSKGLAEFLFDESDSRLTGFCIHWPNKLETLYLKTNQGEIRSKNIIMKPDGTLEMLKGKPVKNPSRFSNLISTQSKPAYTNSLSTKKPIAWAEK